MPSRLPAARRKPPPIPPPNCHPFPLPLNFSSSQARKYHRVDDEWDAIQAAGEESPRAALADQFSGLQGRRWDKPSRTGQQVDQSVARASIYGAPWSDSKPVSVPHRRHALPWTTAHRTPPPAPLPCLPCSHARRQLGAEPPADRRPRIPRVPALLLSNRRRAQLRCAGRHRSAHGSAATASAVWRRHPFWLSLSPRCPATMTSRLLSWHARARECHAPVSTARILSPLHCSDDACFSFPLLRERLWASAQQLECPSFGRRPAALPVLLTLNPSFPTLKPSPFPRPCTLCWCLHYLRHSFQIHAMHATTHAHLPPATHQPHVCPSMFAPVTSVQCCVLA